MINNPCIGLFGTCGNSKWRESFIDVYQKNNIHFYNPDKGDKWTPDDIILEAEHLSTDSIILFPVTGETYGLGSLSETGLSIMSVLRSNVERFVVVYIDMDLNEELTKDNILYKESMRSRKLVYNHLLKLQVPGLFLVDSIDIMLEYSLKLYNICNNFKMMRCG